MTFAELAVVGALGVAGLGLVGIGVHLTRRRRGEAKRRTDEAPSVRRIRVELEEDPIVAAMVGQGPAGRRRP